MINLQQLDMTKLSAIVWRIVSPETVQDAHDAAQKIQEAADIIVEAGMRILGIDDEVRDYVLDPGTRSVDQARAIDAVVAEYQE